MKQKIKFLAMLFMATLAFAACDNDDDDDLNAKNVPESVTRALKEKYPAATRIEWERKGDYYVADCHMDGKEMNVWFDASSVWQLTQVNITWSDLPATVQTGFNATKYASWKLEEVDMLEYSLQPLVYVIEVEQGKTEIQLFFSESGGLMQTRDVTGKDDTLWP